MKIDIIPYSIKHKKSWDNFVEDSANGTFLHKRDYMDYHADRFEDASLMLYNENKLIAVLPAHRVKQSIFSHKGLTYAEILLSPKNRMVDKSEIIEALLGWFKTEKIKNWEIKSIPSFFHSYPDESLHYLYTQFGAKVTGNLAFFLLNKTNYKLNKNRSRNIRKVEKNKNIKISFDVNKLKEYWEIVESNLVHNHNSKPVHSYSEMRYLMEKFPDQIKLATIMENNNLLAGIVFYKTAHVIHFQYIQSVIDKTKRNSIDYLTNEVVKKYINIKNYISLGSAQNPDGQLNEGLVYWKESFGARVFNQYYFKFEI
jgi:hypothetical protein